MEGGGLQGGVRMEGESAPDFCLPNQDGEEVCLSSMRGKWVVLYFYPRDNTKGCTQEALDFTSRLEEFENLGAIVLGVSPDSVRSHKRFAERHGLRVTLLSDEGKEVLKSYGVWKRKKRYGREFYGVERSTFLIDPEGIVRKVWRNVRVKGHVEEVLEVLRELAT